MHVFIIFFQTNGLLDNKKISRIKLMLLVAIHKSRPTKKSWSGKTCSLEALQEFWIYLWHLCIEYHSILFWI